jgi:hypothetical protein
LVRELIRFAAAAGLVSTVALGACTGSEAVDIRHDSGAVTSSGEAGSGAGTAGTGVSPSGAGAGAGSSASSSGSAGSTTGQAGKTGGTAGAPGTTGSGTGTAGSSVTGTGTAGTGASGKAGTGGNVDAGAAGTTGTTDGGVMVYTYSHGIENLLVQNCGGCHYAAPGVSIQGGFSFSYANVTGVTSGHPNCVGLDASKRRVVPGKPDNSLLWIKAYNDNPPSTCGGHMPFQGSRLSDTTLGYIKAWILAGAPP